jgi:endonuclease/exonuclease/phosphatase family metal-dependent hydrolase
MSTLRIATWNIEQGNGDFQKDQAECLASIVSAIDRYRPDIMLLNEICKWNAVTYNGIDQVDWLQSNCGFAFGLSAKAATLAFKGGKYVAALSRLPLTDPQTIVHSSYADGGGYATLWAKTLVNGRTTHVFSTRLTAHDADENLRSTLQLRDTIAAIPRSEDVFIGGDFNTGAAHALDASKVANYSEFIGATGLHNVLGDDVGWGDGMGNAFGDDHLFVRGPWSPGASATEAPIDPNPSDHPWVRSELSAVAIRRLAGTLKIAQPIRVGVSVNFAVDVRDQASGAPVPTARILVDGVARGLSGQAFGIVFNARYTRGWRVDPSTHARVAYWIGPTYPVVSLAADGFETAVLPITFTGAKPPPDPID